MIDLIDQMRTVKLPEGLTLRPDEFGNARILAAQVERDSCTEDVLLMLASDDSRFVTVHGWRAGPRPEAGPDRMRYVRCHPDDLQGAVDYVLGLLDGVRP